MIPPTGKLVEYVNGLSSNDRTPLLAFSSTLQAQTSGCNCCGRKGDECFSDAETRFNVGVVLGSSCGCRVSYAMLPAASVFVPAERLTPNLKYGRQCCQHWKLSEANTLRSSPARGACKKPDVLRMPGFHSSRICSPQQHTPVDLPRLYSGLGLSPPLCSKGGVQGQFNDKHHERLRIIAIFNSRSGNTIFTLGPITSSCWILPKSSLRRCHHKFRGNVCDLHATVYT